MVPVRPARFLLPENTDLTKWSVVACDQHTSDLNYWKTLENFVGGAYSTLNLIFPEAYLGKEGENERIQKIADTMNRYLSSGIFRSYEGMVLVERTQGSDGKVRKGILLAVDLEHYSFKNGEKPLIRASEGTVLERIPPRVHIRKQCALELPHIMLLYDDPGFTVLNALKDLTAPVLYDFELNMNGGRLKGIHIQEHEIVLNAFTKLLSASKNRFGEELLFAVGDGNHSLAAAKTAYEQAKSEGNGEACRYALCEAVNLYDPALSFEPIHRLVFTKEPEQFLKAVLKDMPQDPIAAVAHTDAFIKEKGLEADYIHGTEHLKKLAKERGAAAVGLKAIDKSGFFPYVIKNGSLPKKTFSMGEAEDKRYYLEAAKIR